MAFCEILAEDYAVAVPRLFLKDRLLLTAEDASGCRNAMTVGWGGIGVFWGKPVVFYGIRPERYTFGFAEEGRRVSLSAFPHEMAEVLSYCGTHSGRDGDKCQAVGITPIRMTDGGPGYAEASLVITARKCYAHAMRREELLEGGLHAFYEKGGFHTLYIAEIGHIYLQE